MTLPGVPETVVIPELSSPLASVPIMVGAAVIRPRLVVPFRYGGAVPP